MWSYIRASDRSNGREEKDGGGCYRGSKNRGSLWEERGKDVYEGWEERVGGWRGKCGGIGWARPHSEASKWTMMWFLVVKYVYEMHNKLVTQRPSHLCEREPERIVLGCNNNICVVQCQNVKSSLDYRNCVTRTQGQGWGCTESLITRRSFHFSCRPNWWMCRFGLTNNGSNINLVEVYMANMLLNNLPIRHRAQFYNFIMFAAMWRLSNILPFRSLLVVANLLFAPSALCLTRTSFKGVAS